MQFPVYKEHVYLIGGPRNQDIIMVRFDIHFCRASSFNFFFFFPNERDYVGRIVRSSCDKNHG